MLFFFSISFGFSQANDIIVLHSGDTVQCKIDRISSNKINFTYHKNGEEKHAVVLREKVKTFKNNPDSLPAEEAIVSLNKAVKVIDYDRWSMQLGYGYANIVPAIGEPITNDTEKIEKSLQQQNLFYLNASYFFTKNQGIGLSYAYSNASQKVPILDNQDKEVDELSVEERTNYIAPILSCRFYLSEDHNVVLLSKLSAGILSYRRSYSDKQSNDFLEFKGRTLGYGASLGLDYKLNKYFGIGMEVNALGGRVKDLTYSNKYPDLIEVNLDEETQNISRIGFLGGVRVYL